MDPRAAEEQVKTIKALGGSGFPLQTAVASAIRSVGIYQLEEEIAWRDRQGSDAFLDMVAVGQRVRLMIECKKTSHEKFVFLLPADGDGGRPREDVHCVYLHQVQDSTRRGAVLWGIASAFPMSEDAMFCVAESSSSDRLLEKQVQPLVRAT